ncbi:MAG: hypothetical protein HKM28_03710 [Flavobacteriaceae bacterium]|nr:hypothetical protein [Flavobacteriaceae bacterium]
MKLKITLLLVALMALSFQSCTEEDNTIDQVFADVSSGAVLRTIEVLENSIPINIEGSNVSIPEGAGLSAVLEMQDAQGGDLLSSVEVFVSFTDGSPSTGDSSSAPEGSVSLRTIDASEFSDGPFGLPRYTLTVTADEMLAALNLVPENLFGGDVFGVDLALTLTDGRVFNSDNAGGVITAGFFNSPFAYNTPVVCELPEGSFTGMYLIEEITPYVDGPTFADGSVVEVEVGDTATERFFLTPNYPNYCSTLNDFVFQFVCGEIFVPFQESNCVCGDGTDFFGPAENPSNYDPNDDSVFFITFSNDTQTDCGPPQDTTYKLTKQ